MDMSGHDAIEPHGVFQGRYEVMDKLSEGGFGVVFKAKQLTTGQHVAIKCLRRKGNSTEEREAYAARFEREMMLYALLHHPNIVGLIDSGHANGQMYMVLEYVPGNTLADVLRHEVRLSPRETVHLMAQALDALGCAHNRGVIHRDLKPSNIMIMDTGARRNALVLDFGIGALGADIGQVDNLSITAPTDIVGTPTYAAPEQLRSSSVAEHADLYSWGLVFIECLTGERVVPGRTVAEVIQWQLSSEHVPIPAALRGHPLGALLEQVTSKDIRIRRRLRAGEVLRELSRIDAAELDGMSFVVPHVPPRARRATPDALLATARPGDAIPEDLATEVTMATMATAMPSPPASSTSSQRRARRDERRQITALSYVVRLAPTAGHELDIEEQAEILAAAQARCAEVISRTSGHLAETRGHRGLAFFGYPRAHGEDARRAINAGLALITEVAESPRRGRTPGIRVHIGVHTGLVLVRGSANPDADDEVFGDTPALAATLADLASANTLVISAETRRLVRRHFELTAGRAHTSDSLGTPIDTFLVRGRKTTIITTVSDPGPLVGRDEELALLARSWRRACDGHGQVVQVTGEAGIGKTRLAGELRRSIITAPHVWLEWRCLPEARHSSLRPVAEGLGRLLELGPSDEPAQVMRKLEAVLARYRLDPADTLAPLAVLLGVPAGDHLPALPAMPQRRKELTMHAVLALLGEIAARQPLALVAEDLHWADPTTLELLGHLVDEAAMMPMCIVATMRPELQPAWHTSDIVRIQLGRLSRVAIERIVASVTGGKRLPATVLDHVERRTDGVPLFVEELTRAILESPALVDAGEAYELRGPMTDLRIPATLRDSLTARLDRLEAGRDVAQLAAVLGREFTYAEIAAVSEQGELSLRAALTELVAAGLVHRRRRLGEELFSFKHALIQEIAYDSLPRRTRKQYHSRVASIFARALPGMVENRPELFAHHHAQAEEFEAAVEHAVRAGRAALQRSASAEAAATAELALEWVPSIADAHHRAEAELALISVLTSALMAGYGYDSAGFRTRMQQAAERIEELGTASGSPHALIPLWGLWSHHFTRAEHREASAAALRSARLVEHSGAANQRVMPAVIQGMNAFYTGHFASARAQLEQAICSFDPVTHADHVMMFGYDSKSIAHGYLASVMWMLGHADTAAQHAEQALARAQELDSPVNMALTVFLCAKRHVYEGDHEPVLAAAQRIVAIAEESHLARWRTIGILLDGWARQDAAVGSPEGEGYRLRLTFWRAILAESHLATGDMENAISLLDQCISLAGETEERYMEPLVLRLRGEAVLRAQPEDTDAAMGYLRRAIEVAKAQNAAMPALMATTSLCRLLARIGRTDQARSLLAAACEPFEHAAEAHAPRPVRAARALLAEL